MVLQQIAAKFRSLEARLATQAMDTAHSGRGEGCWRVEGMGTTGLQGEGRPAECGRVECGKKHTTERTRTNRQGHQEAVSGRKGEGASDDLTCTEGSQT
eukprot:6197793-Pleurochrysis_carterae.AAC.6